MPDLFRCTEARSALSTRGKWLGRSVWIAAVGLSCLVTRSAAQPAEYLSALESITARELHEHVEVLADDVYEGRAAGSRGGHAAGGYIVQQIERCGLTPAGSDGAYFQPFGKGYRNLLAMYPGEDPELHEEIILVGAHYDHLGYGKSGRSLGTIGTIHNGADDNASGVAALLEVIEALTTLRVSTRRSILFVFWDAEEIGLLGSKHWLEEPTVPLLDLRFVFNVDMVGRLREGRLQVLGTRTGTGLRRFVSGSPPASLSLDFNWVLARNSDHWSFFEKRYPILMLHTGLHEDYHKESDDVERINSAGEQAVSRYLFELVVEAANADHLPEFRSAAAYETEAVRRHMERPLPPMSLQQWPADVPPPRLGISWREDSAEPGTVYVTRVVGGTPADAAGLGLFDRIYAVNGSAFADKEDFRQRVLGLLDAGAPEIDLLVESHGHERSVKVRFPSLSVAGANDDTNAESPKSNSALGQ